MAITWNRINNTGEGATYSYDSDYEALYDSRISVSRDGQTIALVNYTLDTVEITTDGGTTWITTQMPGDDFAADTGCANDGFVVLAGFDSMWKYNWDTESWENIFYDGGFETVSCSETGQYLVTISWDADQVYYSNDYGASWTEAGTYYATSGGTAISKDGSVMMYTNKIFGGVNVFEIYASYNYGENWAKIYSDPIIMDEGRWIAMDDDGINIVVIFDYPDTGIFSTDGGANWTSKNVVTIIPPSTRICSSYSGAIDLSYDGTAIVFSHWTEGIWTSNDFGDSWTKRYPTLAASDPAWGVDSCVYENYWRWYGAQFIGTSNTDILIINERYGSLDLSVTGGVVAPICFSNDLGATWTYDAFYAGSTIPASWGVASDATSSTFLIGSDGNVSNPSISTDSGNTWTNCTVISGSSGLFLDFKNGVAMSSSGLYMALLANFPGWLYLSSNRGTSWNKTFMPGEVETDIIVGTCLGMSYNGSCILVYKYDYTDSPTVHRRYISTDYGVSFTDITASSYYFTSIAMNNDGSFILCSSWSAVYSSSDYGNSFTDITSQIISDTGVSSVRPHGVEVDITGNYLYIPDDNYGFLYSTNGGTTWQKISASELAIIGSEFNGITCSYNGEKVFLSDDNTIIGQLFVSDNYGVEWTSSGSGLEESRTNVFEAIDSNETGSKLIGSTYQYVYLGRMIAGRIKSIAGILFESILKVSNVPISNLKKISGEEN